MHLINEHGPLIGTGEFDDATYELRGETHPMVNIYRKVGRSYHDKATQLGGTPLDVLVLMLAAELPKA